MCCMYDFPSRRVDISTHMKTLVDWRFFYVTVVFSIPVFNIEEEKKGKKRKSFYIFQQRRQV